jgi:hypothetical protein
VSWDIRIIVEPQYRFKIGSCPVTG